MTNQDSYGPPTDATSSQALEGLITPNTGLDGPSDSHDHPSETAQIRVEDPASRQDSEILNPHIESSATTPDFDALIASYQLPLSEISYSPWSYTNNSFGQPWSLDRLAGPSETPYNTQSHTNDSIGQHCFNDPVTTSIESPLPAIQPRRRKRATCSSPPPGSSSKRRKGMSKDAEKAPRKDSEKPKRSFPCVFRTVQARLRLSYTCTGAPVNTMSAVRTHLIRNLREKPPHLPFLKLCTTCNEDILDEYEFETFHGSDGLKCENPQPQRKGDARQQEQYDMLCSKVETHLIAQSTTERVQFSNTTEAPEQHPSSLDKVAAVDRDPDWSGDGDRLSNQLPHQEHDWSPAFSRRTPQPVRPPESSTSHPSPNTKFSARYPVNNDLIRDVSREKPMVFNDYTNRNDSTVDLTNDEATLEKLCTQPLYNFSPEAQGDLTPRWNYSTTNTESTSALPSPISNYDTPFSGPFTPCTSSTTTPAFEPEPSSTLLRSSIHVAGSGLPEYHAGWTIPSRPMPDFFKPGINYAEHEVQVGSQKMFELGTTPSDDADNGMEACDKCAKVFRGRYRKGNLRRHKLAFHSPLAFVESACRVCKKAYKRTDATRKHEWKKHRLMDAMPEKRRKG